MIALSVIAAFVVIFVGALAVATRQIELAHRRAYREEVALNKRACAYEAKVAKQKAKPKPRAIAKRRQPTVRPVVAHGNPPLTLH